MDTQSDALLRFKARRKVLSSLIFHPQAAIPSTVRKVLCWRHRMRYPIDSQIWSHAANCMPYWASNETQNRCSPIDQDSGALQESEFRCRCSLCPERRSLHPSTSLTLHWSNLACFQHHPAETGDESRIPCLCLTNNHSYAHWQFSLST